MDGTQILTLGLGLEAPWILKNQHLDTAVSPHRLDLYVEAERGSLYPVRSAVRPVKLTTLPTKPGGI
ncbi:hypothetical protein HSBAA_PA_2150 (plasmid) [Vreelandella sulfidaeris]|uniref:Uncharacterized protein n=1 Tax=Vreelandella sulfidaeris TaxID=115553 RepID=A0A455UH35_9GAMM|nr:hypothetical protein HSBAA_PA_2150 [Halomonas sulfidaeris]